MTYPPEITQALQEYEKLHRQGYQFILADSPDNPILPSAWKNKPVDIQTLRIINLELMSLWNLLSFINAESQGISSFPAPTVVPIDLARIFYDNPNIHSLKGYAKALSNELTWCAEQGNALTRILFTLRPIPPRARP